MLLQNEGNNDLFINKHDQIAQLLILPCVIGKVQKGQPPTLLTVKVDGDFGSMDEAHSFGAKVWVKQPNRPPISADVTAQGKDNTVLVMIPRQEKWKYVPLTHCYSCE